MIVVECKMQPVYRCAIGRKGRLSKRRAYLDAAWQTWKAKHPCTCHPENRIGEALAPCREHAFREVDHGEGFVETIPDAARAAYRKTAITRLARWLMWRDGRKA